MGGVVSWIVSNRKLRLEAYWEIFTAVQETTPPIKIAPGTSFKITMRLRSTKAPTGIHWPAMFFGADAEILAMLCQLQLAERWPADVLQHAQRTQLTALLEHTIRTVPFYAARLRMRTTQDMKHAVENTDRWQQIPILTREHIQTHGKDMRSDSYPPSHGRTHLKQTSGSTGQPVEVLRTDLTQRYWEAAALREHTWNQRDASLGCAVIRALTPDAPAPHGLKLDTWGYPYDRLWRTGHTHTLNLATDIATQADWLRSIKPAYLLTYPTNAAALLNEFAKGEPPPLKEIICLGEPISDTLVESCRAILGARVSANYSSQEAGYLAILCPDCGQYHVQSESVLLEVLDAEGRPCQRGITGRVVITDLHNFAMPLIRYELGDYAEVGGACSAGRTLLSLKRILGRQRNMVLHPDGGRHWPLTGFARFSEVAPIRQYQFVQHGRTAIEVRLVADVTLTPLHQAALAEIIHAALGYTFELEFTQHAQRLDRGAGGKFEEFVCLAQ